MADGEPHPSAQTPVLPRVYLPEVKGYLNSWNVSITGSRLAFCIQWAIGGRKLIGQLVVWDWKTGDVLWVRCMSLSRSPLMQIVR